MSVSVRQHDAAWPGRVRHMVPYVGTLVIGTVILRIVPLSKLAAALKTADYVTFAAVMFANTVFYFVWDTWLLWHVMRWFHRPIAFSELLPARAASYIASLFNTNIARAALAYYLKTRTGSGFLQLGSTVVFLVATEFTHLALWATAGVVLARGEIPLKLLFVAPIIAAGWLCFLLLVRVSETPAAGRARIPGKAHPRDWNILRTFRIAGFRRYVQIIALRAPMFFVSLLAHYMGAKAFGINLPFVQVVTFLPVIFMAAALPITVAHLGTTQAAWILFFGRYAPAPRLLAFSLAAHLSFTATRAILSLIFVSEAFRGLMGGAGPGSGSLGSRRLSNSHIWNEWALR